MAKVKEEIETKAEDTGNAKKGGLLLIIYLGILAAMAPLATDMYLPALPEIQQDFGTEASMIQMTLTMTLVGMATGQIFAGPVSDYCGRKKPLFVGMAVFMLSSLGCILVNDIKLFLAFRLVQGWAGSCGIVISRAIARDMCKGPELTRFFAILMMVNGLAPIISPVLGGQILAVGTWKWVFGVLTGIGLIMSLGTLAFTESLPEEKRQKNMHRTVLSFPILWRDKAFRGHCLIQAFVMAGFFAYIGSSSFIFQGIYHVTAQQFSYIFGGIGFLMMIVGTIPAKLAGRVNDMTLLRNSLSWPIVTSVLLFVAFSLSAPLPVVVALTAATICAVPIMGSSSFSMALTKQGKMAGSASAMIGFFNMFLGGIMMPVSGMLGTDTGLPMAGIMIAGQLLAMLCFIVYVKKAES